MSIQKLQKNISSNFGGSVFWTIMILCSFAGLIALSLWSYFNNSLLGIILSVIFFFMVIGGVVLSEGKIFTAGSWSRNSLSFVIGFILYSVFYAVSSRGNYSVLSVSQNTLFSTIAGDLPIGLEFLMNSIVIPLCEEAFFLFGITYVVIQLSKILGKTLATSTIGIGRGASKILVNGWFQIILACLISGFTFAYFHMGRSETIFVISAILFRTIATVVIFGDIKFNLIPYAVIGYGFSLGMHIGNNWSNFGLMKGFGVIIDNIGAVWGGLILILMIAIIIGAFNEIRLLINKKGYSKQVIADD